MCISDLKKNKVLFYFKEVFNTIIKEFHFCVILNEIF